MANDILTGGPGRSNFVLRYGQGSDTIRDFGSFYYKAKLVGSEAVPATASAAKGTALIGLARDEKTAVVHLDVTGLTSKATDADIYVGLAGFTNQSAFDINTPASTKFSVDTVWDIGGENFGEGVSWLRNNILNATVATEMFPTGEIRGQFKPVAGETALDTIDLSAVRITSMTTLRHFLTEVNGSTKVTVIRDSVKSSFTLKDIGLGELRDTDFKFSTSTAKDTVIGTSKVDTLFGGGGNDIIKGKAGNDLLFGEFGNDVIDGGAGRDEMWGGGGRDRFDFNFVSDTGKTGTKRDVIHDFGRDDIIDLSGIDANGSAPSNGKFVDFSFGNSFSGARGDISFYLSRETGTGRPLTIVAGDVDGDKKADFQIELDGRIKLSLHEFIL